MSFTEVMQNVGTQFVTKKMTTILGDKLGSDVGDGGNIQMIHRTMPDIHKMHRIPRRMHILSHRIATFDRESNHRGAPRPCGARPKAAPLLSLSNVVVLWLRTCILRTIMRVLCTLGVILRILRIIPHIPLCHVVRGNSPSRERTKFGNHVCFVSGSEGSI